MTAATAKTPRTRYGESACIPPLLLRIVDASATSFGLLLSLWGILSGVSGGVFGRRLVAGSSTVQPREKRQGRHPFKKAG